MEVEVDDDTGEIMEGRHANGKMMPQGAFAEHIEDGLDEIADDGAAMMLELAQTFHANTGVAFKSSTILASGQRQIQYEETTTAKAGQKGDITIPQEFVIGLAPFEGSDAYRVRARFRFAVRDGSLSIGYKLARPHDTLKPRGFFELVESVSPGPYAELFARNRRDGWEGWGNEYV